MNRIEGGNLIIDQPNEINSKTGKPVVNYYFMAKQWPDLENGKSIIIDAEKLGETDYIRFRNTEDSRTPWHISDINITNIDKPVNTGGISIHGVNWNLEGKGDGLKRWSPDRKFCTGHFGFHVKTADRVNGHGIEGSTLNGGNIKISGVEVQYGFSGIRLASQNYDQIAKIDISNFYLHDTYKGEPVYLGATFASPYTKLRLKMKNGFIARSAADGLQLQHLIDSQVENIVIYNANTAWTHAFEPGQANGIQWSIDGGVNYLKNIVVDGYASMGILPVSNGKGKAIAENILFNNGRNAGMYLHKSMNQGTEWLFKNLYFSRFNDSWKNTGEDIKNYCISKMWGTDPISFENIYHDSDRNIFESDANIQIGKFQRIPSAKPTYLNTGFDTPNIRQWNPIYGSYFPNKAPITYYEAEIVIEATLDSYQFFKCLKTHEAKETPSKSPNFQLLTWDILGTRNDSISWLEDTPQSLLPPDDLRLANWWGVEDIIEKEEILEEYYFDNQRYTVTNKKTYIS